MLQELTTDTGCACGRATQPSGRSARRSASEVVVGLLSLGVWVFIPKCPLCLAAYVAFWTGLGLSFAAAQYVRWLLLCVSAAALAYLVARRLGIGRVLGRARATGSQL